MVEGMVPLFQKVPTALQQPQLSVIFVTGPLTFTPDLCRVDLLCLFLDCERNLQKAVLHQLGLNSANSQLYSWFHSFLFRSLKMQSSWVTESLSIKPALLEAVALKPYVNLSTNSVEG